MKLLWFTEKGHGRHDGNSDPLSNNDDSSSERVGFEDH